MSCSSSIKETEKVPAVKTTTSKLESPHLQLQQLQPHAQDIDDEENAYGKDISTAEVYSVPAHAHTRGRGELEVDEIRNRIPVLKQLNQLEAWMDKKFGVETTGADRILENERDPPNILNVRMHIYMYKCVIPILSIIYILNKMGLELMGPSYRPYYYMVHNLR